MSKWERDPYDVMAQIAQSKVGRSISSRIKTEGCPSLEVLDLYMERKLPQEQIETLKTHIIFCDGCAKEILLRERVVEEVLEEELIELIKESYTGASRKAEVERPSRIKSALRFLRSMSYLKVAIALVSVILVVGTALVFVLIITRPSGQNLPPGYGYEVVTDRVGHPSLIIQPKGKVPSVKAFTWKPVPEADSYAVGLFDSSLNLLWKAEKVTATTIAIPEEVITKLKRDAVYRWQVKAYRGSQEFTADEGEFSITYSP